MQESIHLRGSFKSFDNIPVFCDLLLGPFVGRGPMGRGVAPVAAKRDLLAVTSNVTS